MTNVDIHTHRSYTNRSDMELVFSGMNSYKVSYNVYMAHLN